ASDLQRDQLGACPVILDMQDAHTDRQLETPWPGAARIEVEHAVTYLVQRLVRMAGDYHVDACGLGINGQLLEVMQYIDVDRAEAQGQVFRNHIGPGGLVVVATHYRQRCD